MRFLLRPSSLPAAAVGKVPRVSSASTSKGVAATKSSARRGDAAVDDAVATGVAYGQRCGSNCGCVLRIEAGLTSEVATSGGASSSGSPTVVRSSYVAKRVVTTAHRRRHDGDIRELRPLTTQNRYRKSQPILTTCDCPTLHLMAQRTVEYLEGKTLARIRNDMEMGMVGPRSTVAFRHTVLREFVMPAIDANTRWTKMSSSSDERRDYAACTGAHEMNSTTRHVHCYDLVEDTLLSMIHERVPVRRNDDMAESYSPTLGGYFRLYSPSGRKRTADITDDARRNAVVDGQENAIHEESGWLRKSPSSYFLFGDEPNNGANASDSFGFLGTLMQSTRDYFGNRLLGDGTKISSPIEDEAGEHRPTTTYLQMLDIYGSDTKKMDEDRAMADWLEYVDKNSQEYNVPTSA
jgi:hypothetical protein